MFLSPIIGSMLQTIAEWFFGSAEALFSSANTLVNWKVDDRLYWLLTAPLLVLIVLKVISLTIKGFHLTDYLVKNITLLGSMLILCMCSIFQQALLNFSVYVFDSLADSSAIVSILRNNASAELIDGGETTLSLIIITLFSAASAFLIALSETLSILALKCTFILLPVIALLGFQYPALTSSMLQNVGYALAFPLIHSVMMYGTLTYFLPVVTADATFMNALFKVAIILLCYPFAKFITDGLFLAKENNPARIET